MIIKLKLINIGTQNFKQIIVLIAKSRRRVKDYGETVSLRTRRRTSCIWWRNDSGSLASIAVKEQTIK